MFKKSQRARVAIDFHVAIESSARRERALQMYDIRVINDQLMTNHNRSKGLRPCTKDLHQPQTMLDVTLTATVVLPRPRMICFGFDPSRTEVEMDFMAEPRRINGVRTAHFEEENTTTVCGHR